MAYASLVLFLVSLKGMMKPLGQPRSRRTPRRRGLLTSGRPVQVTAMPRPRLRRDISVPVFDRTRHGRTGHRLSCGRSGRGLR